ncbi:Lcl domain-containing protein [Achromobacter pestifer]
MTIILTPPRVGQPWPEQGGDYAGIMRGDDGTLYHVIVSGKDGDISDLAYGAYGEREDGTASKWDGQANTAALIGSEHAHPAAAQIGALTLEGHSDWYLPAQRELSLCWATVPHLFRKDWYWSSTQYSASDAWIQTFDDGYQDVCDRDSSYRARAVRRLPI